MLYLVNEMFKQKNKTLNITFGERVPYQKIDKRYRDDEWAELFRQHVYLLAKDKSASLNI